ncbi:hypothetical protein EPN87_01260 [archaeon]|nr:MAG: hypothetical protein EPN87_01260 [archaeon]
MIEKRFLILVVLLALVARFVLAPLYVSPPGQGYSIVPHDFPKYVATANTILENRVLYIDKTHTGNSPTPYGPLLVLSWVSWIKVFGDDYTLLKIPSIFYDALTIVLIFYISKSLFNLQTAKYASLFYAFSFILLLMSGADGSDENPLMFFLLLSVYFLVRSKPNIKLSALFLGIALLFKLSLGVVFMPVIIYHLLQQKKLKQSLTYIGITLLTISIITLPFFLKAGTNVLVQLSFVTNLPITGTTFLSAVKMVVNYFTLGMASTYEDNLQVQMLAKPITILSIICGTLYILKFGLKDKRIELVRNIFILLLLFTIFSSVGEWHIFVWLVPYMIILLAYNQPKLSKFNLSKLEILGYGFVIASTVIYAALYRETKIPEYSFLEQSLVIASVVMASVGTYLSLIKTKLRAMWTFSMFSWALWLTNHTKMLMVFGSVIPLFRSPLWSYGIQDFSSVVLITISSIMLFVSVHKATQKDFTHTGFIRNLKSILK